MKLNSFVRLCLPHRRMAHKLQCYVITSTVKAQGPDKEREAT